MTKVDFTMADLQSTMLGYSEGMLVNEDVLRKANRAYQLFHDKYLAIKDQIKDFDEARYAFLYHDMSLEYFAKQAKLMVRAGNYNSLDIFGNYLEYIDSYNDLSALIRNDYMPVKSDEKGV
ncbi:hypothetical protein [Leuconostoc mesenteroides]|uniref:hypothetical protein n=1 Tax=Leuconostoc mesenteroides TaxID=1245 RepID=UPI00235EAB5E|nr:hypothetical protein [Leuconostoc mesenteroides]